MAKKKTTKTSPKAVKEAAAPVEAKKKKKRRTAAPEVEAEEEEVEQGDEVEDADDDVEVEEPSYVADLRSMSLVTRDADNDAALVKKLSKLTDPEQRSGLVIAHAKNLIDSSENQTLALGEALYEIRHNGYWKAEKDSNGDAYTKMEVLWTDRFGISPVTGYRAIKLYDKLIVDLELSIEDIEKLSMTVWRQIVDIVNDENLEEVMEAVQGMTSKEAEAFAKATKNLGLEQAIASKDEEDDDLPEGSDVEEEDDDEDGDDAPDEEPVKTIKVVCVKSTYDLYQAAIDSALSVIPEIKGEKADARQARGLGHIIQEWLSSCFEVSDQCDNKEEYLSLVVASLEDAYGVSISEEDDDEDDED